MEVEDEEKKQPTILSIDDSISRLNGRLNGLSENLKSATQGEQPVCDTKDEVASIPSASIESISQRLSNAHDTVDTLERFMQRFHSGKD